MIADRPLRSAAPEAAPPAGRTVAVIPAHNEDKYIASLVLKVQRYVDHVVVVDDGSTDLTARVARAVGAMVISHGVNQGKGAAVCTGLRRALEFNPDAVVLLDGDGQHRPDQIPNMLVPVLSGKAEMVVGSRFVGGQALHNVPAWRVFGQRVLNLVTAATTGHSLTDSQSGFRAFSRRGAEVMSRQLRSSGFSVESEMQLVARNHGLATEEVPIVVDYDVPIKRNPVSQGLQVLNGLLQLVGQNRPLLFISGTGVISLILGLLLGIYVVEIYKHSHQLAIGYAMITVLLVESGLVAFFVGIVLHTTRAFFMEALAALQRP